MSHTEGKLETGGIFDPLSENPTTTIYGPTPPGLQSGQLIANRVNLSDARRLVACWNACEGLLQDALDGGWTAAGISQYARELEIERDELVKALGETQRILGLTKDAEAILARYQEGE